MAFSKLLTTYLDLTVPEIDDDSAPVTGDLAAEVDATISKTKTKKSASVETKKAAAAAATKRGIYSLDTRFLVVLPLIGSLIMFVYHCTWVTSNAYSSPSVVLASRGADGSQHIIDDFREAYYWLRQNTKQDAVVMSWWDYGYQIAGMADRPTLVDNNTWNNSAYFVWSMLAGTNTWFILQLILPPSERQWQAMKLSHTPFCDSTTSITSSSSLVVCSATAGTWPGFFVE